MLEKISLRRIKMPNGHDYSKRYGPHKYQGENGTSDCIYGCECSVGPSMSHGPAGLDPLNGECPGNPIDGKKIGGKADYEIVVERRIRSLKSQLHEVTERLKRVSPAKKDLAENLKKARNRLSQLEEAIKTFQRQISEIL